MTTETASDRWRGDVIAGTTVAAYLIPQVMAYAGVAGVPAISGLWAAVPALLIYALLGSSRYLSLGPEASTALLSATIVGPLAAGDGSRYVALSAGLALVMGVYCVLGSLLRLGFVADLLSRPVLVGYMAGIAAVMVASQLGRITGATVTGDTFLGDVSSFVHHAGETRALTLAVSLGTVTLVLAVRHWWPTAPGPLLAVIAATVLVAVLRLDHHGVTVVGRLPGALPPAPDLPAWHDLRQLLVPALGLVAVGYSDMIATARGFAGRAEAVDANRELLSLGSANLASSIVHGFPVSSSASRTALGIASGTRSQRYSVVCAAVIVLVVGVGRAPLAHMPTAVLGGLVLYAALRLVDARELHRLARFRRSELLLAVAAAAAVIVVGLLDGVLIAIGLSVLVMLYRIARPHDGILGQVPGLAGMHDIDDYPQAVEIPGLVVYRYDSPLFFANAEDFKRRALAAVADRPDARWLLLNVEANVEVDITGLDALDEVRETLVERGIVVALARVKQDLLDDLEAFGLVRSIGREHIYPTLPTALAGYEKWCSATSR